MLDTDLNSLELYTIINAAGEPIATNSMETMQAISYRIEDGIVSSGERAIFYAAFQQFSRFAVQIKRYRTLAAYCERIYVFGVPDWTPPPIDNVVYVPLAPDSGLAKEWFLVYDAPGYFTSLVAHDMSGLQVPREDRIFRGSWTFQEPVVAELHQALETALGRPYRPVSRRDYERQQRLTANTISEVVGRLESGNRELRRAYDLARQANEENQRLQDIVRRYVAGSTWADAERSIREGVQIQSQVRAVTVMFTDIVNFTPFSEGHNPREVVRALNGYFWWVSRTIAEHGGEINKYTGDGVLAVFANAEAALEAGRVLLDRLAEWNAQRLALGQPELHTRIGINSGRAMIGTIGGPDRQDRTVLGDVVNTAARLQTAARPDTVLISEATFIEAGRSIEYTAQQSVRVKGKTDPITVYEYHAKSLGGAAGAVSGGELLEPTG